ncbi:MAG: lytic murein transglycosylase [Rhodobacteraceae bacterium]|nr:lytic murein transglycosylase [Paracoccaceae bacterium]
MRFFIVLAALLAISTTNATASCGGNFNTFVDELKREAVAKGFSRQTVNAFFRTAALDPKVIRRDRAQGIFKSTFTEFSRKVISQNRLDRGRANAARYDAVFNRAEREFGVDRHVLLAFWALETDYGAFMGDINTANALITLAHDCRRPELFRPQIFAALKLYENGDFDPATTEGAWAGEIGMVQMLPEDILHLGVDGDGNGHVDVKASAADALLTGAHMLQSLGWRAGEPWLVEVRVPDNLDWFQTGLETEKSVADWARDGVKVASGNLPNGNLKASILLPEGRYGPAFMALPNFRVYFEWNQSFVYVTSAAYLATRLAGAPIFNPGNPEPSLSDAEMKQLQSKLAARGHDVGKIDGILGAGTRAAVRDEQKRLGLPADAWPTRALLSKL